MAFLVFTGTPRHRRSPGDRICGLLYWSSLKPRLLSPAQSRSSPHRFAHSSVLPRAAHRRRRPSPSSVVRPQSRAHRTLRLSDEPLPERLISRQRRGQDLQSHLAAQALITRPENYRHPASADLLFQPVARHLRTCGETSRDRGQRVVSIAGQLIATTSTPPGNDPLPASTWSGPARLRHRVLPQTWNV